MALRGLPPGSKCVSDIDESAVSADCVAAGGGGGRGGGESGGGEGGGEPEVG